MTRASLNAETIFTAALRLVDAEGLDALTMRRLAWDADEEIEAGMELIVDALSCSVGPDRNHDLEAKRLRAGDGVGDALYPGDGQAEDLPIETRTDRR